MFKVIRLLNSFFKNKPKALNGYFHKTHGELKIYTHDMACIDRAFNQIFNRDVYNFESESDTPLIIDAGANIGLAILYWKQKYPNARIIAFEPSRLAFKSLEKNVKENNLSNVTCINKALSDVEGICQFTTNEIISGSLNVDKGLSSNYEVETTTIDKYLNEKVDFLKIDIEGAEKFIFNDIKNHMSNLNYIFLEYHSFTKESQYLSDYLNLFEENNFRYFIEGEFSKTNHFVNKKVSLGQDMQLNIWAHKSNHEKE